MVLRLVKIVMGLCVFGAGFITGVNVAQLVEINPNYDANWGKVVLCVVLGAFFGVSQHSRHWRG